MISFGAALVLAYLIGSFPSAYIVGKVVKGIDIREHGSGNVGASNVFRVIGKKWGMVVLMLDILKGFVAASVMAAKFYSFAPVFTQLFYALLVGIAAILGHNWTIFLKFRGGKGVATSLGVALGLLPKAALLALGVWIVFLILFRYISVSSIASALSFPVWIFLCYRSVPEFPLVFGMSLLLSGLIFYTHRSNIERLKLGTEHKIGQK